MPNFSIERERASNSRRFFAFGRSVMMRVAGSGLVFPVSFCIPTTTKRERFVQGSLRRGKVIVISPASQPEPVCPFLSFLFAEVENRARSSPRRCSAGRVLSSVRTEGKKDGTEKEREGAIRERPAGYIPSWTDNRCDYSQDVH